MVLILRFVGLFHWSTGLLFLSGRCTSLCWPQLFFSLHPFIKLFSLLRFLHFFQISHFCLSLCPHTHSLSLFSPSVPPSLCFLVSVFFIFSPSLALSFPPPLPHTLQIGFGTWVLWSVNTHTRSEQRCHCRGDVSRRGLIQSDTCSLPSFPIAMEAITLLLKGLLSECVCVFPSYKGWQGGTSAAGHLIGWIERYGRVSCFVLSSVLLEFIVHLNFAPIKNSLSVCLSVRPSVCLSAVVLHVDGVSWLWAAEQLSHSVSVCVFNIWGMWNHRLIPRGDLLVNILVLSLCFLCQIYQASEISVFLSDLSLSLYF